ncbi:MAG TPA: hypothetical protein VHM00_00720 [Caldimonas sp.]|nr:hypothetical protein [Caldimonas sp.]HEX2539584.1 hypothetical protein [Caldimonas sp.]
MSAALAGVNRSLVAAFSCQVSLLNMSYCPERRLREMPHPFNDQEISMKTKLALSAVAAAVALFSQAALAQTTAPAARADVKSEARTGSLAKPGEATPALAASGPASTKTRTERKTETKTAADAGTLKPAGESSHKADDRAEKSKGTTKTRAERKAETRSAAKTPAGEATPTPEAPKK